MDPSFPREIQVQIEDAVVNHKYESGRILSVEELATELRASPGDVLSVLHAEHRKGLLTVLEDGTFQVLGLRERGKGSVFVYASQAGLNPRSEVRLVKIEAACSLVASKLQVDPGTTVYRFVRTRYINDEVAANQTNFIPFDVCPDLYQDEVSRNSFQRLLEEKYYAFTAYVQDSFDTVAPTEEDTEILDVSADTPVIEVQRIAFSVTEYPLVWTIIHLHPQRCHYLSDMWPSLETVTTGDHLHD